MKMDGSITCMLILLCFLVVVSLAAERSVTSNVGVIIGNTRTISYGSKTSQITQFLGIPFAEPPIGNRRFTPPVKKPKFTTPFNASNYGPSCIQDVPFPQSEDCLYLNVFTPDINGGATKYAVMVFIHGGGFTSGSSVIYDGGKLAAYGQVVVVTFNYRLGPFGFLDVGDKSLVQPNNGLMDQHLAIKWVRDNIASFGGNISRITLFGESAGSASVLFQMLYPPNEGLFQRAIAQSGTCSDLWATSRSPFEAAKDLAKLLNCPVTSTLYMVQCLKEYNDTTSMTKNATAVTLNPVSPRSWSPSYDDSFVVKNHIDELQRLTRNISLPIFEQVDLLMGTNGFEGQYNLMSFSQLYYVYSITYDIAAVKQTNKQGFQEMLQLLLNPDEVKMLIDDIVFQYSNFDDPLNRDKHIVQMVNFLTDMFYLHRTQTTIMRHAMDNTASKTFRYEFDELYPLAKQDTWVTGATHASELGYLFGFPEGLSDLYGGYNDTITRPLQPFSTKLMEYWTNFAKFGNPNGNNLVEWKEFNTRDQEYLFLKSNQIEMRHHLHARRVEFWNSRLPMLIERIRNRTSTEPVPTECTSASSSMYFNMFFIVITMFYWV